MKSVDIHEAVVRQYRASLDMLGQAITASPDSLWLTQEYPNRFWHIAYHALFYTHLYLQDGQSQFIPWAKHRKDYQFLGPTPWPPYERPKVEDPYTKADVLEYLQFCREEVEARARTVDLEALSGFDWLPFNKLELQLYNIRHLQHHGGQLADRLRTASNTGITWVRSL